MEPEEIAVVLARASELHSKLSDAIGSFADDASSSARKDLQNGDSTAEARGLAAIRDALEVLEEQLESLQALQQQQRAERDAGLAEIEESRRVFLTRLKDYRGRELEIVQESLAFAGGSVPDKDDLPPPGYPAINDDEFSQAPLVLTTPSRTSGPGQRQGMLQEQQDRSEVFDFEVEEAQEDEEVSEGDLAFQFEDNKDPNSLIGAALNVANAVKNSVKNSGAFASALNAVKSSVALLGQLVGKITGQVTGPSSKVVLIVVSTLAVLSLTDLGEKRTKSVSRVSRTPGHRSHHHHISDLLSESSSQQSGQADSEKSPAGCGHSAKKEPPQALAVEKPTVWDENFVTSNPVKKLEDDFPKCVVRERLELPFYQELQTPDVLYGRG